MPPELVDVNVHPDEAGGPLPGRRTSLQPAAGHAAKPLSQHGPDGQSTTARSASAGRTKRLPVIPNMPSSTAASCRPGPGAELPPALPAPASQASLSFRDPADLAAPPEFRPFDSTDRSDAATRSSAMGGLAATQPAPADPFGTTAGAYASPARRSACRLHNRYLVTEHEEGMVVIDQHALHERILYEQLRETVLGGALEIATPAGSRTSSSGGCRSRPLVLESPRDAGHVWASRSSRLAAIRC